MPVNTNLARALRLRRLPALDHPGGRLHPHDDRAELARPLTPARRVQLRRARRAGASFTVRKGERIAFELAYNPAHDAACGAALDPVATLAETERCWKDWSGRSTYNGPYKDVVNRSLITLKGMIYAAERRHRGGAHGGAARGDRRRAQLGLPLLLAARRHADARRPDARRVRRRGRGLAPVAPERHRRRAGRAPDHVRHRRRAPPDRVRGALAARLRGVAPRAHRQRRERAVPARRLRRGHPGALRGAAPRRAREAEDAPARPAKAASSSSRPPGRSPTTASGRCAAAAGTSCTPR